jgi:hypothetical protein
MESELRLGLACDSARITLVRGMVMLIQILSRHRMALVRSSAATRFTTSSRSSSDKRRPLILANTVLRISESSLVCGQGLLVAVEVVESFTLASPVPSVIRGELNGPLECRQRLLAPPHVVEG